MASMPILTVQEHSLESTEDLTEGLGMPLGTRLSVVSSDGELVTLRREADGMYQGMTVPEYMAGWDRLRGMMKDGIDTAEERRAETAWELEHDRRKFGEA